MEDILRPIYQERTSQQNTLGVLMIKKYNKDMLATDTFDSILFIVVSEAEEPVQIKHYQYQDKKAALYTVTEKQLKQWLMLGTNKKIIQWLLEGKVIFDRNEYLSQLRKEMHDFPFNGRKLKIGLEFAKLIRRYLDGKAFFEKEQYLDTYNHIVHSLHHLARLSIIEHGYYPELTVWKQVKQIEPEITKLYEELVGSTEPLEKRLELLFLASEYLIGSKIKIGAQHFIDILDKKEQWSFNDIRNHKELTLYSVDTEILLEYLIDKGLVEVVAVETKSPAIYHRYYKRTEKLL